MPRPRQRLLGPGGNRMAAMVETKLWRLPDFIGKNRSDDEYRKPSPAATGREIS
jgi:hypothetical protein